VRALSVCARVECVGLVAPDVLCQRNVCECVCVFKRCVCECVCLCECVCVCVR